MAESEAEFLAKAMRGTPLAEIDPSWYPLMLLEIWRAAPEAFEAAQHAAILAHIDRTIGKKE